MFFPRKSFNGKLNRKKIFVCSDGLKLKNFQFTNILADIFRRVWRISVGKSREIAIWDFSFLLKFQPNRGPKKTRQKVFFSKICSTRRENEFPAFSRAGVSRFWPQCCVPWVGFFAYPPLKMLKIIFSSFWAAFEKKKIF